MKLMAVGYNFKLPVLSPASCLAILDPFYCKNVGHCPLCEAVEYDMKCEISSF
jgi:hypothetical protein